MVLIRTYFRILTALALADFLFVFENLIRLCSEFYKQAHYDAEEDEKKMTYSWALHYLVHQILYFVRNPN